MWRKLKSSLLTISVFLGKRKKPRSCVIASRRSKQFRAPWFWMEAVCQQVGRSKRRLILKPRWSKLMWKLYTRNASVAELGARSAKLEKQPRHNALHARVADSKLFVLLRRDSDAETAARYECLSNCIHGREEVFVEVPLDHRSLALICWCRWASCSYCHASPCSEALYYVFQRVTRVHTRLHSDYTCPFN